jgi:hypothetical protein
MTIAVSGPYVFAEHAMELQRAGFAVLPAEGKSPLVKGWSEWRRRPRDSAVADWAKRFPNANIAYTAGPSGLIVVDADDEASEDLIISHFGETPGQVKSRRGKHFLYSDGGAEIPRNIRLADLGINGDLKYGNGFASIVIAPPSLHPEGGEYRWQRCDPKIREEVPPFRVAAFQRFLDRAAAGSDAVARRRALASSLGYRAGSRKLGLNDHLCSHVSHCADFGELLEKANDWNDNLDRVALPPLSAAEVLTVCKSLWKDFGAEKLTAWQNAGAVAPIRLEELQKLNALGNFGSDAVNLLIFLRSNHGARCRRGETFAVTPKAMESANCIDGWSAYRYKGARDLLLEAGYLKCVQPHDPRTRACAQYWLVPFRARRTG